MYKHSTTDYVPASFLYHHNHVLNEQEEVEGRALLKSGCKSQAHVDLGTQLNMIAALQIVKAETPAASGSKIPAKQSSPGTASEGSGHSSEEEEEKQSPARRVLAHRNKRKRRDSSLSETVFGMGHAHTISAIASY
jgi:hypothetical protein